MILACDQLKRVLLAIAFTRENSRQIWIARTHEIKQAIARVG